MVSPVASESFFCLPEPGKPDPNQPWDPSSKEPRKRVVDHGQKGVTCEYYALQLLRNNQRIGKHPPDSLKERREMEQALSKHRKEITKINQELQWRILFACQLTKDLSGSCTREVAQKIIKDPSSIGKQHRERCCAALKDFCSQDKYDEFVTFADETYTQALMRAEAKLLLGRFKLSYKDITTSIPERIGKVWEKMTLDEKHWHQKALVFSHSYRAYGCKKSLWHPGMPLEALIQLIESFGPHMIMGQFGQVYYKNEPFELKEKIEGRSVFGWKPNAKRNEIKEQHCILIVGVRSDTVYFIDPLDGSDPKDITTQKIYAMSYETLKSSISNLSGARWKGLEDGKPHFEKVQYGSNNYALSM